MMTKRQKKTDDLMCIILMEAARYGGVNYMIVGDINADLDRIPMIQQAMGEGEMIDVGAVANIWGRPTDEPTARVSHMTRATRIDYLLIATPMLQKVKDFAVDQRDLFPTHKPIYTTMEWG